MFVLKATAAERWRPRGAVALRRRYAPHAEVQVGSDDAADEQGDDEAVRERAARRLSRFDHNECAVCGVPREQVFVADLK